MPDIPRSTARPNCYGDVRVYDPKHPECRDQCRFFPVCGVVVRGKLAENKKSWKEPERSSTGSASPRGIETPRPEDYLEREDDAGLGFWGALAFNGALSGIRAGLVEAVYATDQIPRVPYRDPFAAVMKKPVRRTRVEPDEEEDVDE